MLNDMREDLMAQGCSPCRWMNRKSMRGKGGENKIYGV